MNAEGNEHHATCPQGPFQRVVLKKAEHLAWVGKDRQAMISAKAGFLG